MQTVILFLKTYYKQIGIIVLFVLLLFFFSQYKYFKSESERKQNNIEQLQGDSNKAIIIHKGELKQYEAKIDSLRAELGIRPKTIKTIFKTAYLYSDSTILVPVYISETIYDTIPVPKEYNIKSNCYDLTLVNTNDTILSFLNWHDHLTGFIHWERPHKFWFIRWGAKEYHMQLYSDCQKDTIKIDKLIIQE